MASRRGSRGGRRSAPRPKTGRLAVGLLLGAGLVIFLVVVARRGDPGDDRPSSAPRDPAPAARALRPDEVPGPTVIRDPTGRIVGEKVDNPLEGRPRRKPTPAEIEAEVARYLEHNKYPPTSRPLGPGDQDLMNPQRRSELELPSPNDPTLMVLYSADKAHVVGGEPLRSFLQVRRNGEPVPVTISNAMAVVPAPEDLEHELKQVQLDYRRAADGTYVNQFTPAELGITAPTLVRTRIWFTPAGGSEEIRFLNFYLTPAQSLPARFTGHFRDAVEGGSLVVYAGIEVLRPGQFAIDCNLYGPAGEPVAWTRYKGELPAGRTEARLEFFGKVIVDQAIAPPYHIGQLRGVRVVSDGFGYESMAFSEWSYTIQSRFTLGDLSSADWDSPHKQHMLDLIREHGPKPEGVGPGSVPDE